MENWKENKLVIRLMLHITSLLLASMTLLLIINQQQLIKNIVEKYFKVNIRTALLFLTESNRRELLREQLRNMSIEISALFFIQIFFFVLGLVLVIYFLIKLKKIDSWGFSEKLIMVGCLFLAVSSIVIFIKIGLEFYQTYIIIGQKINTISYKELRDFKNQVQEIFLGIHFSLEYLVTNFMWLLEQILNIQQHTHSFREIPELVMRMWNQLLILRQWLLFCTYVSGGIIFAGNIIEGVKLLINYKFIRMKLINKKKSRHIELNEQLTFIVSQQNKLIECLIEMNKNLKE
ncbi:hypothetical protein IGJ74_000852 [Enterococcus sp. AZ009]|uniref:hypothetical protein n=1 Tax=Enterococcus sp. AZ009 TaxID=2774766 RepID=UPI003D2FA018